MRITKKIAERLELRDDATEYGGKTYIDEKLDHFMADCEIPFGTSLKKVNKSLVRNGLEPFSEDEVTAVKEQLQKKPMTSSQLNETIDKARNLMSQSYVITLNAVKRVVRENGGHITLFPYIDVAKGLVDRDEIVKLHSCYKREDCYELYGLQLDSESHLEFLAFDPRERKGVVLQNQCLEYDITAVADTLLCKLEEIEMDKEIDKRMEE